MKSAAAAATRVVHIAVAVAVAEGWPNQDMLAE
jgi:hypothetical protein